MSSLTLILLSLLSLQAHAGLRSTFNASLGISNISVNENESTLEATDPDVIDVPDEAQSVAASTPSVELQYEMPATAKRSYYLNSHLPVTTGAGDAVFQVGGGVNFYLSPIGSNFKLNHLGSSVNVVPKYRYYWGLSSGVGYLIYNTISAKKSDVFLNLGAHLGGTYNFSQDWGVRGDLSVSRGVGVTTSSMTTRALIGVSYYL